MKTAVVPQDLIHQVVGDGKSMMESDLTKISSVVRQSSCGLAPTVPSMELIRRCTSLPMNPDTSPITCSICANETYLKADVICTNEACAKLELCVGCSNIIWKDEIKKRRYFVSPLRCFNCKQPIPYAQWKEHAGNALADELVKSFKTAFSIRCSCEEYSSLLTPDVIEMQYSTRLQRNASLTQDELIQIQTARDAVLAYEEGAEDNYIDLIIRVFGSDEARRLLMTRVLLNEPSSVDVDEDEMGKVDECGLALAYIEDFERRASVLSQWLRRPAEALASTVGCCHSSICFVCKTLGHFNAGSTCAEEMAANRKEMNKDPQDIEIHVCPSCSVPFEHAGGCSAMQCVCGEYFNLEDAEHV